MSLEKPDYGIDAPGVVLTLILIGAILILVGFFLPVLSIGSVNLHLRPMALWTGPIVLLEGMLMLLYAKVGKFRHRDQMLDMVSWRGNESILDVGTGRGLLMIGAAKRLTTGQSVGIDIWNKQDLSGNSRAATLHNAELEGVQNKIRVEDNDATAMKFPDNTFDVVVSNLCIHNIPTRAGRDRACAEIVRVLKPGGTALISDFKSTADYQKAFQAAGATAVRGGMKLFNTFPPLRIVEVKKPL